MDLQHFDIESSVGFMLAKAHQRLFAHFREELAPFGITPPQFALLAFLWKNDSLPQVELSEKTQIDRTTTGGLIDRLQKAGLVERRPNPHDRRSFLVHLTTQGRALEKDLIAVALRARKRFTSRLSDEEYNQLNVLLEKLRDQGGMP